MRAFVPALLVLAACATRPPLAAPQWDEVPARITDALCMRMKMDAVATGRVSIVTVTQPLITPESLSMLRGSSVKRTTTATSTPPVNRAIPIALGQACEWLPIGARDIPNHTDEMIVELSSPIASSELREVGMFARVTLGGEHPSWYWLALVPTGDHWSVRFTYVLSQ